METIDDLLKNYRALTEEVAKSNALNEKVFKEIVMRKVRGKVNVLYAIDIFGLLIGVLGILFFAGLIVKCAGEPIMFVLSILLFISTSVMMFVWGHAVQWRLSNKVVVSGNVVESIHNIKDYIQRLRRQRLGTMIAAIPVILLEHPVFYYVQTHKNYLDYLVGKWDQDPSFLILRLAYVLLALMLSWKLYDWVNFKVLKKVEDNLKELEA